MGSEMLPEREAVGARDSDDAVWIAAAQLRFADGSTQTVVMGTRQKEADALRMAENFEHDMNVALNCKLANGKGELIGSGVNIFRLLRLTQFAGVVWQMETSEKLVKETKPSIILPG